MKAEFLRLIFGVLVSLCLLAVHEPSAAKELCAPSEATDPQPLHINGSTPFIYKTVGGADLRLHVFSSARRTAGRKSPAVVYFFGGGWIFGDIRRFQSQATHLALRGLVTVLVDYRVQCRNGTTILDAVADAKSAMRWVRGHADELEVDPSRIAAVGSSAGGQLAAATALVPGLDDPADEKVDAKPNALVLYNPALDLTSKAAVDGIAAFVGEKAAQLARRASPIDHLDQGLPPTLIFQGTADKLVAPATAEAFCMRARVLKFQCELVLYPGAPHGFTEVWLGLEDPSLGLKTEEWERDTTDRTDAFLTGLGWLSTPPSP